MFRMMVCLLALLPATALASPSQPTDRQLFYSVLRAVNDYPRFSVFDSIDIAVNDGVVALEGKVTMPFKRDDLERRVRAVPGVKELRNGIEVLPVSSFDDDLRYAIARRIYGNPSFWQYASMPNPPIHIVVEKGHVTLKGVVVSEVERMLARSLAGSAGAFSVSNELLTEKEAAAAIQRVGRVEER